jgi:uncharacterized protein YggE
MTGKGRRQKAEGRKSKATRLILPTDFFLLPSAFCLCLAFRLCLAFCPLPLLAAAENDLGVTVTASGEALTRPDCLEIDLRAAGEAELSSDAIVKYQDRLRRVTNAFEKLDVKQLRLEQRELSIGDAVDEQHPRPHVTIARALRIVVTDIQELAEDELLSLVGKVIDTAKDTGAGGEEPQAGIIGVRFAVRDAESPRAEACRKAFDHARKEANRFARLAGGRLGRALSVQDLATGQNAIQETISAIYGQNAEVDDVGRIVSDSLKEIPVRVSLRVRFELLESSEETAKTVADQ